MDLSPGVNVIVGPSDCGKTAIIRALRWLAWNRPTGEAFRSDWGGETRVEVNLNDEIFIARFRDKENGYNVGELGTNYDLKAMGADVPDKIRDLLNLDDTNLQQQLDSPFLISASPGEVAAYFNRIAHLEKIDLGLRNLAGSLRKLSISLETKEESREKILKELMRYEYVDKAEAELEVLEQMDSDRLGVIRSSLDLQKVFDALHAIDDQLLDAEHALQYENPVNRILGMWESHHLIENSWVQLDEHIARVEHVLYRIEEKQALTAFEDPADEIITMMSERAGIKGQLDSLDVVMETIADCENALLDVGLEIRDLEERFHEHMPDVCPLCGK